MNKGGESFVFGNENIELVKFDINASGSLQSGEIVELSQFCELELEIIAKMLNVPENMIINFGFLDQEEKLVLETFSSYSDFYVSKNASNCNIKINLGEVFLNAGLYNCLIGFVERKPDGSRGELIYVNRGTFKILVKGQSIGYAPVQLLCDWS
jgi:hypothetical protein